MIKKLSNLKLKLKLSNFNFDKTEGLIKLEVRVSVYNASHFAQKVDKIYYYNVPIVPTWPRDINYYVYYTLL